MQNARTRTKTNIVKNRTLTILNNTQHTCELCHLSVGIVARLLPLIVYTAAHYHPGQQTIPYSILCTSVSPLRSAASCASVQQDKTINK